jgi:hypothetical protein
VHQPQAASSCHGRARFRTRRLWVGSACVTSRLHGTSTKPATAVDITQWFGNVLIVLVRDRERAPTVMRSLFRSKREQVSGYFYESSLPVTKRQLVKALEGGKFTCEMPTHFLSILKPPGFPYGGTWALECATKTIFEDSAADQSTGLKRSSATVLHSPGRIQGLLLSACPECETAAVPAQCAIVHTAL